MWDIIEYGYVEIDWDTLTQVDMPAKRYTQKNNSFAIYHLQSALDKRLFPRITSCNMIKDVWKVLKDGFQGNDQVKKVRLQTLKIEFENLKQKKDEKVGEYYVRVKICIQMMETLIEEIKNIVVMNKVLRKLLPKWSQNTTMFEKTKYMSTLTIN